MTRIALVTLLCLTACKAHLEEESRRDEHKHSETDTDRVVDKHVVDAPDKTTTTIEEFATGEAQLTQGRDPAGKEGSGPRTAAPSVQFLVRRTVIVAEHGAVTTDLHVNAKSQEHEDTDLDEQHRSKFDFGFLSSPLTWIGAGVVVVAAIALKLRKAAPL